MLGFEYINNWQPFYIPISTIFFGLISFFSVLAIGRIEMQIFQIKLHKTWNLSSRILLGIFTLSLLNQVLAILKINNSLSYIFFILILSILSSWELKKIKYKKIIIHKRDIVPITILSALFTIRFVLSIIPSTKNDEIAYHMMLPLRIVTDQSLIYYHFPWPASIWPHMHYQILGAPFYSIGFPDAMNLLSLGIFSSFIITIIKLILENTKKSDLALWGGVLIASGLYSTVETTTIASNSLLVISSAIALIIICDPSKYIPSKELKSFSLYYSLLFLGVISSKISMIPAAILMIIFFIKIINDYWSYKYLLKAFLFFLLPITFFYLPLLINTWIVSGSPFGSFLYNFFTGNVPIYDPFVEFSEGNLGYRGNLKEILFFLLTKWSPLIWVSWVFLPLRGIKLRSKLTLGFIFVSQFFIIWVLLPNRPRHFGGFQYTALILIFIEILPIIFERYKKYLIGVFIFSSLPWLILDFYYSYPLVSKAFFNPVSFKNSYVPFFNDFKKIDLILEDNAQILVSGINSVNRLNSFHSPRKTYSNLVDIKDKTLPTYLFLVGDKNISGINDFKLKKKVYENIYAKKLCYRTPGRACGIGKLSVYRIEFQN